MLLNFVQKGLKSFLIPYSDADRTTFGRVVRYLERWSSPGPVQGQVVRYHCCTGPSVVHRHFQNYTKISEKHFFFRKGINFQFFYSARPCVNAETNIFKVVRYFCGPGMDRGLDRSKAHSKK